MPKWSCGFSWAVKGKPSLPGWIPKLNVSPNCYDEIVYIRGSKRLPYLLMNAMKNVHLDGLTTVRRGTRRKVPRNVSGNMHLFTCWVL